MEKWLWAASLLVSLVIGTLLGQAFLWSDGVVSWIEEHDGLAAWLQFLGATAAIIISYSFGAREAANARQEAERTRLERFRAAITTAKFICIRLSDIHERYAYRMPGRVGDELSELAKLALAELRDSERQLDSLPLYEFGNAAAQAALRSIRAHLNSAREV